VEEFSVDTLNLKHALTGQGKGGVVLRWGCALSLSLALVACGGGGSSASDSANAGVSTGTDTTGVNTLNLLAGGVDAAGYVDGAGSAARFKRPWSIVNDGAGNVYVADDNSTIRKITPSGAVSTVVSWPGRERRIVMAADRAGNLYVPSDGIEKNHA
jgi:hypothetical protein